MGLLQCLLFSVRRAFEGALRHTDLPSPAALVRLAQLLSLHAVQLKYPFAFLGVAHPRLLRRRELPLFQRFEITVRGHALGFAAIDDAFGFSRIVRLAFEERHGPANQAFTVCAKRFQRFFLPLIDALDLVRLCIAMAVSSFSLKLCISSRCRVRTWSVCRRCSSCCCAF